MATYVQLDGLRTWYDEHGTGEPLVLLHPGLVDSRAFAPNLAGLARRARHVDPAACDPKAVCEIITTPT
jgi:pimeloyl-ACP methyl ester carboxylesterase